MTDGLERLKVFARREDGAITVDYTVLTAIGCGAAIAAANVIWGGLDTLTANVNAESSGELSDTVPGIEYTDNFENGAPASWNTQAVGIPGLGGQVLAPVQTGESIEREFVLTEDISHTTIGFDLYGIDVSDGGQGQVFVEDHLIGTVTRQGEETIFVANPNDIPGVDFEVRSRAITESGQLGGDMSLGSTDSLDSRTRFEITYRAPDPNLGFRFEAIETGTSQYGYTIDDFSILGTADPNASPPPSI